MKDRKISGKEISLATGISESTISKFLSGNQEPRYSQIINLANALHLSPDVFMSLTSTKFETNSTIINEYYMVRTIFNDKYSNLLITTFHAFKDFILDIEDVLDKDALYISIILDGKIDTGDEIFQKGDHQVYRGSTLTNRKAAILKDTKSITFVISDNGDAIPDNWSELIFKHLKPHNK